MFCCVFIFLPNKYIYSYETIWPYVSYTAVGDAHWNIQVYSSVSFPEFWNYKVICTLLVFQEYIIGNYVISY